MDASTIAAVAALVVALLALLIALAQVLQQYFVTGQLIRMCDSIVYGKMPGKGHRVWQASQFRFRVVYSIPQIRLYGIRWRERPPLISDHHERWAVPMNRLPELGEHEEPVGVGFIRAKKPSRWLKHRWVRRLSLWWSNFTFAYLGSGSGHGDAPGPMVLYRDKEGQLVEHGRKGPFSKWRAGKARKEWSPHERTLPAQPGFNSGEASWVSFCRTVQPLCRHSITYDMVEGDADRCPADLPVVPMQISLREVIAMAFMAGMEVTSASFAMKILSMQGSAGTISSAQHPILGALIHFSPNRGWNRFVPMGLNGVISQNWISRMEGLCIVADKGYSERDRKYIFDTDGSWFRSYGASWNTVATEKQGYVPTSHFRDSGEEAREKKEKVTESGGHQYAFKGKDLVDNSTRIPSRQGSQQGESHPQGSINVAKLKGTHDGDWSITKESEPPRVVDRRRGPRSGRVVAKGLHPPPPLPLWGHPKYSEIVRPGGRTIAIPGIPPPPHRVYATPSGIVNIERRHPRIIVDRRNSPPPNRFYRPPPFIDVLGPHRSRTRSSSRSSRWRRPWYRRSPLAGLRGFLSRHNQSFSSTYGTSSSEASSEDSSRDRRRERRRERVIVIERRPSDPRPSTGDLEAQNDTIDGGESVGGAENLSTPTERSIRRRGSPQRSFPRSEGRDSDGSQGLPGNSEGIVGPWPPNPTVEEDPRDSQISNTGPEIMAPGDDNSEDDDGPILEGPLDPNDEGLKPPTINHPGERERQGGNEEVTERQRLAFERQEARRVKAADEARDQEAVHAVTGSKFLGATNSSGEPIRLIGWNPMNGASSEDEEAIHRQEAREEERRQRDQARETRRADIRHQNLMNKSHVTWFWAAQMDIFPGNWVTPWYENKWFYSPICAGAISVVLEGLLGFSNKDSAKYVRYVRPWDSKEYSAAKFWAQMGRTTWPSYAQNARGGVIAPIAYTAQKFPEFEAELPAIDLLWSYDHQVSHLSVPTELHRNENMCELMILDSWLSLVGRQKEIASGRSNLLKRTASLVQYLSEEFELEFEALEMSANEGGLQKIQAVAASFMDALADELLSEAEQVFVLVAMMRAAKVGLCIYHGADSDIVREFLRNDAQVYLA